jgi:hypothetical protein
MNRYTCVIRNVAGIDQYIPINDAFNLLAGERSFTGLFTTEIVKDGPSKSHSRTICLPCGQPDVAILTEETIKALGK